MIQISPYSPYGLFRGGSAEVVTSLEKRRFGALLLGGNQKMKLTASAWLAEALL